MAHCVGVWADLVGIAGLNRYTYILRQCDFFMMDIVRKLKSDVFRISLVMMTTPSVIPQFPSQLWSVVFQVAIHTYIRLVFTLSRFPGPGIGKLTTILDGCLVPRLRGSAPIKREATNKHKTKHSQQTVGCLLQNLSQIVSQTHQVFQSALGVRKVLSRNGKNWHLLDGKRNQPTVIRRHPCLVVNMMAPHQFLPLQ